MSFIKKLTDKNWLKSKTVWLSGIFGSIGAVMAFGSEHILPLLPDAMALTVAGYFVMINNGIAFINRFFTKTGIWAKTPDAGSTTGVRVESAIKGGLIPAAKLPVEKEDDIGSTVAVEERSPIFAPSPKKVDQADVAARLAPHLLTVAQYFRFFPANEPEHNDNAAILVRQVNALLAYLLANNPNLQLENNPDRGDIISGATKGGNRISNETVGAPQSSHKVGMGVDIFDPIGALDNLITDADLAKFDLYREDPAQTKSWVHLQTRPASRRTFFI